MTASQSETVRPEQRRVRTELIPAPRPLRRDVTVRRVSPWSVLKISLLFYFCLLLIGMVALGVFWSVVIRLGLVQALQDLFEQYGATVTINGGNIARVLFLVGLVNVVLWSGINTLLAVLYNLIADLVGGLRVTMVEEDRGR